MRFSGVGFLIMAGGLVEGSANRIGRELRKYISSSHFFPSAPLLEFLLAKSRRARETLHAIHMGQLPRAQSRA